MPPENDTSQALAEREQAGIAALGHVLGTGDLAKLSPLEARLDGPPQQVDDLPVQAPGFSFRAFLDGCVKIGRQPDEHANQLCHDRSPPLRYCYNSSTILAECSYVHDDVVVGEIRRSRDVGLKAGGRVIGVACVDCGAKRWTQMARGKRGLPLRCVSCSGRRTHPFAVAGNAKPRPWQSERQRRQGNPNWKGGRVGAGKNGGYRSILVDDDDPYRSMATREGYVMEHRLVMARALGRPLHPREQVHHLNGVRTDNRLDNLELWKLSHPSGVRQADYHCPGCRCGEDRDEH